MPLRNLLFVTLSLNGFTHSKEIDIGTKATPLLPTDEE